jgi:hypothetical protein
MPERLDGSPLNEPCANTNSPGTADSSSRGIGPQKVNHTTGPVPLYLVPQALSLELHRLGDAIAEVQIRRTRGHNYRITVTALMRP